MASSAIRPVKGLVAFVTGGASGLGRATVERFVREGAKGIVAFDRSVFDHNELTKKNVLSLAGDVTSEDDVKNAFKMCESEFGRVDAVVNCAGIGIAMKIYNQKREESHDLSLYENVIHVNLIGTFNVNRIGISLMAKNELVNGLRGVIVNTASIAAFEGQVGQVAYSSSKAGIVGMTLPIARDVASLGIRVNTIAPGLFATPLLAALPEKVQEQLAKSVPCPSRLGAPDEFAHLVQFLVENPMMNGATVRLDGALRMQP